MRDFADFIRDEKLKTLPQIKELTPSTIAMIRLVSKTTDWYLAGFDESDKEKIFTLVVISGKRHSTQTFSLDELSEISNEIMPIAWDDQFTPSPQDEIDFAGAKRRPGRIFT